VPGILKSCNLSFRLYTLGTLKQNVIVGVGIERRVKVDQVYAFVWNLFAENIQIISEI
jgi:hypothetical protein